MNGTKADIEFVLRSMMKKYSHLIVIAAFYLSGLVTAHILRIFERRLTGVTG
jgi:hypothetical protein